MTLQASLLPAGQRSIPGFDFTCLNARWNSRNRLRALSLMENISFSCWITEKKCAKCRVGAEASCLPLLPNDARGVPEA